jgi:phage terminase Nu1 subunit (DNA packaging protein)
MTPNLINRTVLAERLGVSKKTVARMEKEGLPKITYRPGGHPRYDLALVNEWIASPRVQMEPK